MDQDSDILSELFESPAKVKALKLFLRNPEDAFSLKEGARRLRLMRRDFAKQVKKFKDLDLVRSRINIVAKKVGKRTKKFKEEAFHANSKFLFYNELQGLLTKSSPTAWEKKLEALKALGRIKLAVIAGTLVNDVKGRLDLLLVGEKMKPRAIATFMRKLEADVGKDIRYMVLSTQEFSYRFDMFDNFLRDVFERPHKKLINKMKTSVGE